MKIKSDKKLSPVVINEYNYAFICLNEQIVTEMIEDKSFQCYEYDYNEFKTDGLDVNDIRLHPEKYLNYKPQKELTLPEKVTKLEKENQMLTDCVLEMSAIVYQ